MTIAIVYNGGNYGTYLEWALTTLATDIPVVAPFNANGNSHKFRGNHAGSLVDPAWKKFANKEESFLFVRLHPKTQRHESLDNNLNQILDVAEKIVYLYPDPDSILLNVNNFYSKIWEDWWSEQLLDPVFANNLYSNWPIQKDISVEQIPVWIKREMLSFYLIPAWHAQVEWYHPDRWSHPRCQIVSTNKLLYDFDSTMQRLQEFCNLEFKKNISDLVPSHNTMLSLQQYLFQDQLCHNIFNSILNNQLFEWENIPLPSQGWLQWQLRKLGYEIRCNGLDMFPTNSVQLKKLLYPV
jgi:uncharacterized protein (DUF736 family)